LPSTAGGYADPSNPFGQSLADRQATSSWASPADRATGGYLASTNTNILRHDRAGVGHDPWDASYLERTSPRTQGMLTYDGHGKPISTAYAAESNYLFYVFFVLSIAVNLWMIHLLRTLYLRYKNLLTSLRSGQAAASAYTY
jgi:hypothetical protein